MAGAMRGAAAVLLLSLMPSAALAGPCIQWRAPERIGSLDTSLLPEASGIAASRSYPGRLYLNNDSGDGPYFYFTDMTGGPTARVAVSGMVPRDVEDVALGACPGAAQTCLWLGDIGDNARKRDTVTFVALTERADYPAEVAPLRTIAARYPDGPHDAESFAIHPDGDLFLITKDYDVRARTNGPGLIYRLRAARMATARPGDVLTFEPVGRVDLPALIADVFINQVATAMDISPDGTRVAVLTYRTLMDWNVDLAHGVSAARKLAPGRDYTLTPLGPLPQAEAVAWLANEDGVVYTTEAAGPAKEAPLYRQLCAKRD